MSLIQCPECQHEISDQGKFCSHCGYQLSQIATPINEKKVKNVMWIVGAIVAILLAISIIDVFSESQNELSKNADLAIKVSRQASKDASALSSFISNLS